VVLGGGPPGVVRLQIQAGPSATGHRDYALTPHSDLWLSLPLATTTTLPQRYLKGEGILVYCVSSGIIGKPRPCFFDSALTQAIGERMIRVETRLASLTGGMA